MLDCLGALHYLILPHEIGPLMIPRRFCFTYFVCSSFMGSDWLTLAFLGKQQRLVILFMRPGLDRHIRSVQVALHSLRHRYYYLNIIAEYYSEEFSSHYHINASNHSICPSIQQQDSDGFDLPIYNRADNNRPMQNPSSNTNDCNINSSLQIKYSDVIKLILQFLKENNLNQSFECLQKQSKIALNTLDHKYLASLVVDSDWPTLIKQLNYLMPSQENLFDLYEIIVDDLIEKDAFLAANFLIKNCLNSNPSIVENYKERILRMEYICQNPAKKALYQKPVTSNRRESIIARLSKEIHQEVQSSRLLALLTQAIKFQVQAGLIAPKVSLSLYEDKQQEVFVQGEKIIKNVEKVMKYTEETRVSALKISNRGEYIAIGGIDGLIEIYDPIDYVLHTGLAYQAEDIMFYHDQPISHIEFNETDDILASCDLKGGLKLWNMDTGKLLRKLQHETAIGAMCWGNEPSHLLIGYHNIKLYGVRSCNVLKEYVISSQNDYILDMFISEMKIYSSTHSGTIRIHNYRTQEQINYVSIKHSGMAIKTLPTYDRNHEVSALLFCFQRRIIQYDHQLGELSVFNPPQQSEFVNMACVDGYIYECYALKIDAGKQVKYKLQVRDRKTGKVVYFNELQSKLQTMVMQRSRNLLLTYDEDNSLNFWRP